MDAAQFFRTSRILIVAGKGGVGKSTVSGALAVQSARTGIRTVHIALGETAPNLPDHELLSSMVISPGRALSDYLAARGLGLVSRQLANSGVVELVASTAPGIDDLLVLGKIKSLTKNPDHELIVVDGPAAGHALDMLRTPAELRRAVSGGPIAQQADDVLAMLADASMCRAILVTTPAMTPVTETIESASSLVRDTSLGIGCCIVNMCDPMPPALDVVQLDPELREAHAYAVARADSQRAAIAVLEAAPLAGHDGHHVPILRCARHRLDGLALIDALAEELSGVFGDAPTAGHDGSAR